MLWWSNVWGDGAVQKGGLNLTFYDPQIFMKRCYHYAESHEEKFYSSSLQIHFITVSAVYVSLELSCTWAYKLNNFTLNIPANNHCLLYKRLHIMSSSQLKIHEFLPWEGGGTWLKSSKIWHLRDLTNTPGTNLPRVVSTWGKAYSG